MSERYFPEITCIATAKHCLNTRSGEGTFRWYRFQARGYNATLHLPSPVQVSVNSSRQGSGSRLSRDANSCISRTVTYDVSVRANCSVKLVNMCHTDKKPSQKTL